MMRGPPRYKPGRTLFPTRRSSDLLQDDWYDFLEGIEELDLKGKEVALFGCGDETMSDTFNSAMGILYERLQKTGAEFIDFFNADGYEFDESKACVDGRYVGLLLDEVNKPELTDSRIATWVTQLKKEIE